MMFRSYITAILACMLCVAYGCSHQDFGRPFGGTLSDVIDSGASYDGGKSEQEALLRSQRLAKALAEWRIEDTEKAPDYHIGPDDILTLNILSFEKPGEISQLIRTVSADGTLNLSWAGSVKVDGLNITEAESAIKTLLEGKFLKDPQVTVVVTQHRSAAVVITGAVSKPGVYYLKRDRRTVLEILAQVDGLAANASDEMLLIRGANSSRKAKVEDDDKPKNLIRIDLSQLLGEEVDLRQNVWITGGDMLTVQPKLSRFVYVVGYVQRPGSYDITGKGDGFGPLQAVAMAGGLSASARAQNSCLIRQSPKGQQIVPVDLTKIARGARPTFQLESGDTLVVGSSFIARLSEFIKPSVSAGASFSPTP